MEQKPVTISDVARLAEVSVATVSRVLSGGGGSPAARERVESSARTQGYRRQASERRAEPVRDHALALVISDLANPYYSTLLNGAEHAARRAGWPLTVIQPDFSDDTQETALERILSLPVSGAVVVGAAMERGDTDAIRQRLCRIARRMPIVTIGPQVEGVSCVNITSDLSLSVRKSLAHLSNLGHRRIAFIGGAGGMRSSSTRRRAYWQEMARLGLSADGEIRTDAGFTPQAGEFCVNRLFSGAAPDRRPTAIIAINDLVALGALRQLERMGLRVPEDVALIGCDNQFFTPYLNPSLTTVDLHPFDHGVTAIEELISALDGGGGSYSQIRECSLIVRESCGAMLGPRTFEEG